MENKKSDSWKILISLRDETLTTDVIGGVTSEAFAVACGASLAKHLIAKNEEAEKDKCFQLFLSAFFKVLDGSWSPKKQEEGAEP